MQPFVCWDTESNGLSTFHGARPFALSWCNEQGETGYISWPVDLITREVTPNPEDIVWLNSVLDRDDAHTGWFNFQFDSLMLRSVGVSIRGRIEEVSFTAKICNNQEYGYQLKPLAKKYVNIPDDDEKALGDMVKKIRRHAAKDGFVINTADKAWKADYWLCQIYAPEDDRCETYARFDAVRTMALWKYYEAKMAADPILRATYEREISLMPAFDAMVRHGVRVDIPTCYANLFKHQDSAAEHQAEVDRLIGWHVDVNSGQQVQKALFDPLPVGQGLVPTKTTPTGQPSTDWKALRAHRHNPVVKEIEEVKSAHKACNTFFQKYMDLAVYSERGYWLLHPGLNQLGAALTGRVSCSNPALQTLQKENSPRGLETVAAREPFGPRPGYIWWKVDYSAQEVRIFAELAKCQSMLDAFANGLKIHNVNANRAWGGKDNPAAIEAASYALELGNRRPSTALVAEAWASLGWEYTFPRERQAEFADRWLETFGYDIIKAEESVGKNQSKTKAKNVFFAKIYGGGVDAVVDMLFCSDSDAAKFLARFDTIYPEISAYSNYIIDLARRQGFIITPYDRKLFIHPYEAYKAINYSIQSPAADIMKESIRKCDYYLRRTGLDAHIVMTVHDELIFEVKIGHDYPWLLKGIKTLMESTRMTVPMVVECSLVRECWNHAEELYVN